VTDKVFIDANVFLDTILKRSPHNIFSDQLLGMCERAEVEGFSSTLILANLHFVVRKMLGHEKAIQSLQKIRSVIKILPLTDKEIGESIQAGFRDFEDGLQYFICVNHKITCFITRNVDDFKKASIAVLSPKEYLDNPSHRKHDPTP
jgi:predicted nucleic acid-binding protein